MHVSNLRPKWSIDTSTTPTEQTGGKKATFSNTRENTKIKGDAAIRKFVRALFAESDDLPPESSSVLRTKAHPVDTPSWRGWRQTVDRRSWSGLRVRSTIAVGRGGLCCRCDVTGSRVWGGAR